MLIVNADDWGRNVTATDNILECFQKGRITSVSAMVFMSDSSRATGLANGCGIDTGLHINLSETFSGSCPQKLREAHTRVVRFLRSNKFAQLVYHPVLCRDFASVVRAQLDEFRNIFGKEPSHFDGHQHMHLCMNVLFSNIIPSGSKVRRSFTFDQNQKSSFNRTYRALVDSRLSKRHKITDAFFALSSHLPLRMLTPVLHRAKTCAVELMVHPELSAERDALLSSEWTSLVGDVPFGSYSDL